MAGSTPALSQHYSIYHCRDGSVVAAFFSQSTNSAYLDLDGRQVILPRRLSADGSRYAQGGVTFWIKGRGAALTRGRTTTQCTTG